VEAPASSLLRPLTRTLGSGPRTGPPGNCLRTLNPQEGAQTVSKPESSVAISDGYDRTPPDEQLAVGFRWLCRLRERILEELGDSEMIVDELGINRREVSLAESRRDYPKSTLSLLKEGNGSIEADAT
jgi:hypothetical protein